VINSFQHAAHQARLRTWAPTADYYGSSPRHLASIQIAAAEAVFIAESIAVVATIAFAALTIASDGICGLYAGTARASTTTTGTSLVLPVLDSGMQLSVLLACVVAPTQSIPPSDGVGLVQLRVCVPPPHSTEQAPKSLNPPLTSAAHSVPNNDMMSIKQYGSETV
jgi:hypothetical protein